MLYYQSSANNGYSGDLEVAMFPSTFLKDVFQYSENTTSKVLTENATKQSKPFALLFEEEGDTD
ncbi:MAG: phage tail protein, partial [Oscillospiraceae bacterium]